MSLEPDDALCVRARDRKWSLVLALIKLHCVSPLQEHAGEANGEGLGEGVVRGGGGGGGGGGIHTLLGGTQGGVSGSSLGGVVSPELSGTEDGLIEKTLLSIQEKVQYTCEKTIYSCIINLG